MESCRLELDIIACTNFAVMQVPERRHSNLATNLAG